MEDRYKKIEQNYCKKLENMLKFIIVIKTKPIKKQSKYINNIGNREDERG